MSEIELLRLITWPALALSLIALWVGVVPLATANGSRPVLWVMTFIGCCVLVWSLFSVLLSYNLDDINSTGLAYAGVWYARIYPSLVALSLIWLGRWMKRRHHHGDKH